MPSSVRMISRSASRWAYLSAIILSFATIGCDSADYTQIERVDSPEGKHTALLIRRRGRDSLSSDVYYAVITSNKDAHPQLARLIHDHPVLVATHGEALKIQWVQPNALNIICDRCSVKAIDLIEKNPSADSVKVDYVGLP